MKVMVLKRALSDMRDVESLLDIEVDFAEADEYRDHFPTHRHATSKEDRLAYMDIKWILGTSRVNDFVGFQGSVRDLLLTQATAQAIDTEKEIANIEQLIRDGSDYNAPVEATTLTLRNIVFHDKDGAREITGDLVVENAIDASLLYIMCDMKAMARGQTLIEVKHDAAKIRCNQKLLHETVFSFYPAISPGERRVIAYWVTEHRRSPQFLLTNKVFGNPDLEVVFSPVMYISKETRSAHKIDLTLHQDALIEANHRLARLSEIIEKYTVE